MMDCDKSMERKDWRKDVNKKIGVKCARKITISASVY